MLSFKPRLISGLLILFAFATGSLHAGTELISNSTFGSGTTSWTLDLLEGAKGSITVETGPDGKSTSHIVVPDAVAVPFHVQLFQAKLNIVGGQTYHLTFRARSAPDAAIGLNLMVGEAPWTNLWKQDVKLTAYWQTFSFDINPTQTFDNARVTFTRLGAQAAEYWITDVSLTH